MNGISNNESAGGGSRRDLGDRVSSDTERRAGEILRDQPKDKGAATPRNAVPEQEPRATLAELGITKDESSKWQKLAAVPKEKFEARLAEACERPRRPRSTRGHPAGRGDQW